MIIRFHKLQIAHVLKICYSNLNMLFWILSARCIMREVVRFLVLNEVRNEVSNIWSLNYLPVKILLSSIQNNSTLLVILFKIKGKLITLLKYLTNMKYDYLDRQSYVNKYLGICYKLPFLSYIYLCIISNPTINLDWHKEQHISIYQSWPTNNSNSNKCLLHRIIAVLASQVQHSFSIFTFPVLMQTQLMS